VLASATVDSHEQKHDAGDEKRVGKRTTARQHAETPREGFVDEIGELRTEDGGECRETGRPTAVPNAGERQITGVSHREVSPGPHTSTETAGTVRHVEAERDRPRTDESGGEHDPDRSSEQGYEDERARARPARRGGSK
jgi:hypothetical protein